MKKTLFVVAAILTIGLATLNAPANEQAHDTWQPEPKMSSFYGNDIR